MNLINTEQEKRISFGQDDIDKTFSFQIQKGTTQLNFNLTAIVIYETDDRYLYSVDNNLATLEAYLGDKNDLEVINEIELKDVTSIGPCCFEMNQDVINVKIEEGIKSID